MDMKVRKFLESSSIESKFKKGDTILLKYSYGKYKDILFEIYDCVFDYDTHYKYKIRNFYTKEKLSSWYYDVELIPIPEEEWELWNATKKYNL